MTPGTSAHVYRVDKFVVPEAARGEFLGRVREAHEILRSQPGFIRDVVLERSSGPGRFNFVTVAEWESPAAVEGAKRAIAAAREGSGFDPQALFDRLAIEPDLANYTAIDV